MPEKNLITNDPNMKDLRSWWDKVRLFLTAREPLSKKLDIGLEGCTNGDRGKVVRYITVQHTLTELIRFAMLIGSIGMWILAKYLHVIG
jgi:endonuclease V-like protein UPF0215 family